MTWRGRAVGAVVLLCVVLGVAGGEAARPPRPALPDALTPVLVRSVASIVAPVLGDDGRYHVVYELWLTNAKALPATVGRIEVLDAADHSRVVKSLSGDELAAAFVRLTGRPAGATTLAQDESRIVFVELGFDRRADVPDALVHRLTGMGASRPAAREPSPISYVAGTIALNQFRPPVLGPPLKGRGWVAVNGCCLASGPHRSALQSVNGSLDNGQRFAIDWVRLDDSDRFVVGDPNVVKNWVGYDEPVFAVAGGVVVSTGDGLPDQPPGQLPDPPSITLETVDGNHVVIDIGRGLFVFYAHLKKGSLTVRTGDRVPAGKELGRLGNSGNTSAPHLHLQVMNGPSPLGSTGLPYVHRSFTLTGTVDPARFASAADQTGAWGNRSSFTPAPRSFALPLDLHILDWPKGR
jgi:hypothetical protein